MEQPTDTMTKLNGEVSDSDSFEIIQKAEVEQSIDDANNNAPAEEAAEAATSAPNPDDNNNTNQPETNDKKYSREFLLQIKQQPVSNLKPELSGAANCIIKQNSANLDSILSTDLNKPRQNHQQTNEDMFKMMTNMGRAPYTTRVSEQGAKRPQPHLKGTSASLIKMALPANEDVHLKEAENAWKPKHLTPKYGPGEEDKVTTDLLRNFRSVLNKLTPENFSVLMEQLKNLTIDTPDRLDSCIKLVFEKAISEPKFSTGYALMCKELALIFSVPLEKAETQSKAIFKNRLISNCQSEFEKHKNETTFKINAERLKDAEFEEDPVKQAQLKAEIEEQNFKLRQRAVGTVHFIGELYKINMLTSKIMKSCITLLLISEFVSEETIECLCKLLATIGKNMEDQDEKKVDLTEYFTILQNIVNKQTIRVSSRIRFMIQDLIDMRKNKWKPRRNENKPKTIDQIQKEVTRDEINAQFMASTYQTPRKDDKRGGRDGRDGRDGQQNRDQNNFNSNSKRTGMVVENGWSTPQPFMKNKPFDMKKIGIKTAINDNTTIKLGHATMFQNFMSNRFTALIQDDSAPEKSNDSYDRGSSGAGSAGSASGAGSAGGGNQHKYNYNGRSSGGSSGYSGNNDRNDRNDRSGGYNKSGPGSSSGNYNKRSGGGNRPNNNNNANQQSRNSNQSYNKQQSFPPGHSFTQQQPSQPSTTAPPTRSMNPNAPVFKVGNPIMHAPAPVKELIVDTDKVVAAFKPIAANYAKGEISLSVALEKLEPLKLGKEPLTEIYNVILDKDFKGRWSLTELLSECIVKQQIDREELLAALKEVVDIASDLLMDLPLIYAYIAQYISLPLYKKLFTLKDFANVCQTEIESNNGHVLLKEAMKLVENKFGKENVTQLFGGDLSDFLGVMDAMEFLKQNNFEYVKQKEQQTVQINTIDAMDKVQEMLQSNTALDSIGAWINANVLTKDNDFIRALATTTIEHCIEGDNMKVVNSKRLEALVPLLQQFVNSDEQLELQVVYAIQKLIVRMQHPQGMVVSIFSCFYDADLISEESFNKWKTSDDPMEQGGKGVVVKSSTQFFTILAQANESDEEA